MMHFSLISFHYKSHRMVLLFPRFLFDRWWASYNGSKVTQGVMVPWPFKSSRQGSLRLYRWIITAHTFISTHVPTLIWFCVHQPQPIHKLWKVFQVLYWPLNLSALAVCLPKVCSAYVQNVQYRIWERTVLVFFFSCFALLFWVVSSHVAGNRISVVNRPKANLKTYLPHQGCQPIISQNALLTLSLSRLRSCAVSCTRVQFSTLFLHMA